MGDLDDHEEPSRTPLQETGGRQVMEETQQQANEAEIPSATKKLAERIAALLIFLYILFKRPRAFVYTTARTVVQCLQIPSVNVIERAQMKHVGNEIKDQLKEICQEESKLKEKVEEFVNLRRHSTNDLIRWEQDFRILRDRLAKCGVDIDSLQELVTRVLTEAQTAVNWAIFQINGTGLVLAGAVFGHCYYWASMPGLWEGGTLILVLIYLLRKVQVYHINNQMVHEGNRVTGELEESRRCYMKSKVTIGDQPKEGTLLSLKEMVHKKIKSE